MIYFDNNATTRVADEVLDAMEPYYRDFYGNPHSAHALGRAAHEGIERARSEVAALLGAEPDEIFFTSCGTESNALVIRGLAGRGGRTGVVTTEVEHPSVLALLRELADDGVISLQTVGVMPDGQLDLERFGTAIDESTLLVSVMLAQNEIGSIYPIREIAEIARRHGALVFTDAVQAAGKIPIDVRELDVDFLTISGHKLHAPKGVGALYIRRGTALHPLWRGGNQEHGLRSGTEAVPQIVGLGVAARLALEALSGSREVEAKRNRFEQAVLDSVEFASRNGGDERLPNTANISFGGLFADAIIARLDAKGLCASAGAACHSGKVKASAVMSALGRPDHLALGAVRFSISRYTEESEIDRAARIVIETARELHQSPVEVTA